MTTVSITLLAIWLLASAYSQAKGKGVGRLRSHDIFSLIPNWSFFAPRPGTSDYHLLFRDIPNDGAPLAWEEIPLADQRTLRGAIWNPQKRKTKTLSDVVRGLLVLAQDKTVKDYSMTLPYLAILNYVSSLPRPAGRIETQFMILKSEGFFSHEDPKFLFLSNLHRI